MEHLGVTGTKILQQKDYHYLTCMKKDYVSFFGRIGLKNIFLFSLNETKLSANPASKLSNVSICFRKRVNIKLSCEKNRTIGQIN